MYVKSMLSLSMRSFIPFPTSNMIRQLSTRFTARPAVCINIACWKEDLWSHGHRSTTWKSRKCFFFCSFFFLSLSLYLSRYKNSWYTDIQYTYLNLYANACFCRYPPCNSSQKAVCKVVGARIRISHQPHLEVDFKASQELPIDLVKTEAWVGHVEQIEKSEICVYQMEGPRNSVGFLWIQHWIPPDPNIFVQ